MRHVLLGVCLGLLVAAPAAAALTFMDERDGDVAFSEGRYQAAAAAYERGVKLYPDNGTLMMKACRAYAVANQQLDRALALCNGAVHANGFDPSAHNVRGLVYYRMGQYKQALDDYDDSLRHRPNHAGTLYMRGLTYLKLGNAGRGESDIAAAYRLDITIDRQLAAYGIQR
jgi:tetratricopeptide (TPR) repeat protein